tara:strand:- start:422 stop:877 length:456 start_codon:yes stop_codon:yes gene_type:complete
MKMKIANKQKEELFVDNYVMTNNASESCVLAGYSEKNSAQMGYYLKKKLQKEIKTKQAETLTDLSGKSITVLQNLLDTGTPNVQFSTAKLILELSGYNKQNINLNIEDNKDSGKTDKELFGELAFLWEDHNPNWLDDFLKKQTEDKAKDKE